jgi:hypothetical protein
MSCILYICDPPAVATVAIVAAWMPQYNEQ